MPDWRFQYGEEPPTLPKFFLDDTPMSIAPEYGTSGSNTYTREALRLSEEQTKAQDNAMQLLARSLATPQISTGQKIAASLLGAIPTLGGYLIGRSIGRPDIPEGTFFKGTSPAEFSKMFSVGPGFAGAQGAEVGQKAVESYFDDINKSYTETRPVLTAMAGIESKRADDLGDKAFKLEEQQMENEEWQRRLPLQAQNQIMVNEAIADATLERQKEFHDHQIANPGPERATRNSFLDSMTPEQKKAYLERRTGYDEFGNPTQQKPKISPADKQRIAGMRINIEQAELAAGEFRKFKSWGALQAAQRAAGLDPDVAMGRTRHLVSNVIKTISGTAASDKERASIEKFVAGDITLGPEQLANYLERFAQREREAGRVLIDTIEQIENPESRKKFFAGSGQQNTEDALKKELLNKARERRGLPPL